jgi:hypothetical protein
VSVLILIPTLMVLGWLFPETPFGKWCYDTTTVKIVSVLAKVQRKHAIMLVIGLVAIQAFAIAMPMDMAFLAVIDTATYLDVILAIGAVAAFNRSATLWTSLRSSIARFTVRKSRPTEKTERHPRARRNRPSVSAGNDDVDGHRVRLAA